MDRKLTFGKYKGQPIKKIIATHIGYIMWCLTNLDWFTLNDEEQAAYDALAIAIVKYDAKTVFPRDKMVSCIKDKNKLKNLDTPIIINQFGEGYFDKKDRHHPVIESLIAYAERRPDYMGMLSAMTKHLGNTPCGDGYVTSYPDDLEYGFDGVDFDDF